MAQVFHPSFNTIARLSAVGLPTLAGLALLGVWAWYHSTYSTGVSVAVEQPVPFSHQHHVTGLGIDCRFCHTSVEDSSFAGIPATEVCMTCHSQVWTNAEMLAPVRESWATGRPLAFAESGTPGWNRVHDLPDFVYFDHSIHVNRGIGCVTCHGQVDQMPLVWKENTLHMSWCLECHRDPVPNVQPRETLFDLTYLPANHPEVDQQALAQTHGLSAEGLTNCSVCHR